MRRPFGVAGVAECGKLRSQRKVVARPLVLHQTGLARQYLGTLCRASMMSAMFTLRIVADGARTNAVTFRHSSCKRPQGDLVSMLGSINEPFGLA